jgi:hypothetical protein
MVREDNLSPNNASLVDKSKVDSKAHHQRNVTNLTSIAQFDPAVEEKVKFAWDELFHHKEHECFMLKYCKPCAIRFETIPEFHLHL